LRFDAVSAQVVESAAGTASLVARLPELVPRAAAFIAEPANRNGALAFVATLVGALAAFLILQLGLGPAIRRASVGQGALGTRLGVGLLQVLLTLVPYGGFLVFFVILSRLFPSFALAQSVALLCVVLLVFYWWLSMSLGFCFAPPTTEAGFLPLSDEDANCAWVWLRRFADYGVFHAPLALTPTRALVATRGPASPLNIATGSASSRRERRRLDFVL